MGPIKIIFLANVYLLLSNPTESSSSIGPSAKENARKEFESKSKIEPLKQSILIGWPPNESIFKLKAHDLALKKTIKKLHSIHNFFYGNVYIYGDMMGCGGNQYYRHRPRFYVPYG